MRVSFTDDHLVISSRTFGERAFLDRELIQTSRAIDGRNGRAKGHRELRIDHRLRIVFLRSRFGDDAPARFEHRDFDALDLAGFQIVLAHDREHGIDRTLHVAAAGVRFDGGVQDLERFARGRPSGDPESGFANSHAENRRALPGF